jgi:chemotaxis protein MotA
MRMMFIEGLSSIAQGENPRHIESRLQGYVVHGAPKGKDDGKKA